jgi:hypothetical protein
LDFGFWIGGTESHPRNNVVQVGLPDNGVMPMAAAERSKSKIENPKSKMNQSLHTRGA